MAVGGCASRKAFRRGTEMQEAGRYDEAVSHFEEAVRLKPKREKYAVALAEAREQAAQYHLSEAKTHLTSRDLVTAQSEIDMALGYSADDASARALRKQVTGEVSRAESLMADARRLGSLREWDRALARISDAIAVHRTLPGAPEEAVRLRRSALEDYLSQGRERLNDSLWGEAAQLARKAATYDANDRRPERLLRLIADRKEAERLVQTAQERGREGRHDEAIRMLERAASLHPERTDVPKLIRAEKTSICQTLIVAGQAAAQEGRLEDALDSYRKSETVIRSYGDISSRIAATEKLIADRQIKAASDARGKGLWGQAFARYLLAQELRPTLVSRGVLDDCRSNILKRTRYRIGMVGLRSSEKLKGTAGGLEGMLLEDLMRYRGANLEIIERKEIRDLLNERDLMAALTGKADANPPAAIKSVDAIVFGDVM